MKLKFYSLLLSLVCTIGSVNAQQSFNMEEAVQYAIENGAQTKLNNLEIARADGQIIDYRSIGLPQINGSVNYQHFINLPTSLVPAEFFGGPPGTYSELQFGLNNNLNMGVEASQLIFDSSFFTGLRAQRFYRQLVIRQANSSDFETRKNVTRAYLSVLIAERNKDIIQKNIDNLEKTLEETKVFFENGFVEKLDVSRLQLSYDNLVTEIDRIDRLITLSKNLLKFQMSFPIGDEIELKESLDDMADKVLVEIVDLNEQFDISKRPEFAVLEATEKMNELNVEVQRKGYLPSLVGFFNYSTALQRNDMFDSEEPGFFPTTIAGLGLSIPIWDSFSKKGKIQMAKVDLEKVKIQKSEFERAVSLEVYNAKLNYQNAMMNLNNTKRNEALANEIYNTTQIKYREGVGSSVELSQAEQNLYAAQGNYINALYDLVVAKTDLDLALGK